MPVRYFIAFFSGVLLFAAPFGCQSDAPEISSPAKTTLSFFYTGELLGELEPCGCSGSKLGGMLIRSGWIDSLKKDRPSLYLLDGGLASRQWERQDQIKSGVYRDVLHRMGYHYRFVGKNEKMAPSPEKTKNPVLLGENHRLVQEIVTPGEPPCKILFLALERERHLPQDPASEKKRIAGAIESHSPHVVWIMTRGISRDYVDLASKGPSLTIFFPVDAQEPFSPFSPAENVLVVSAGNRGRYAGLLTLNFEKDRFLDWKNLIISLDPKFEPNEQIVSLLDRYKSQLKEERLLELQIKRSSPIGFVGSDQCIECHKTEYGQWKGRRHAKAFATLVHEKHDYDPECVGCHTVGYEFEEGFRSPDLTPHLIDVGCETCHGAGAAHIMDPVPGYGKTDGETICLVCHYKDRSPNFEYKKYLEMIKHWKDK